MKPADKAAWYARARTLAWFTIAYNLLEALACAVLGVKDESLSLLGFGTDSLIEAASGAVVLWRFTREAAGVREETKQNIRPRGSSAACSWSWRRRSLRGRPGPSGKGEALRAAWLAL